MQIMPVPSEWVLGVCNQTHQTLWNNSSIHCLLWSQIYGCGVMVYQGLLPPGKGAEPSTPLAASTVSHLKIELQPLFGHKFDCFARHLWSWHLCYRQYTEPSDDINRQMHCWYNVRGVANKSIILLTINNQIQFVSSRLCLAYSA